MLWIFVFSTTSAIGQDCGCIECPVVIEDLAISNATFVVDGAGSNSLAINKVKSVHLSFIHSRPSELQMNLTSPAGQTVTLIGPQGTAASPVLATDFNISFVTDVTITMPDQGMNPIWDNENIVGIQPYNGVYLPHAGSLLNFNTGTVNGDWLLEITDPVMFDFGMLSDFTIIFEDQGGIECCEADAGVLNTSFISACQGDEALLLDISPFYTNAAPNDALYGYTYFITQNGLILEVNENPDLTNFAPGTFEVYGFSFDLLDLGLLPTPNGTLSLSDFELNLQGNNPILCGELTNGFVEVEILSGAMEVILADTICNGESFLFGGEELFEEGIYADTIPFLSSCDSIVQLNLIVGNQDTMELFESSCILEMIGADTVILSNSLGCDSMIITNTSLLPSDTVFINQVTCMASQNNLIDTVTISTPECDSIIITSFFFETPDTIFNSRKTCLQDEIGFDTLTINLGETCDEIEITETTLYLIDTTFLVEITCDPNEVGEVINFFPTDTCDRIEITVFDLALPDTIFQVLKDCDINAVGIDTMFLSNQNNCDSLVIIETMLLPSDTLFLENFTCDLTDVGVDTVFLSNQESCDSLVIVETILSPSDTIFTDVFSCDIEDVGIDTLFLSNQFSCDSLVINTTILSTSDTTFIDEPTCDETQLDPLVEVFSTSTCDSLVITTFTLIIPDTTFFLEMLCDESRLADTLVLQNFQGCDSLVITEFESIEPSMTFLEEQACNASNLDSRIDTLQGVNCDSIVITNFIPLPSDTITEILIVCDISQVGLDTSFLSNTFGCDSLVIVNNVFEEIEPTTLVDFTCEEELVRVDSSIFLASNGCDSLVITDFVLSDADTSFLNPVFTCDPSMIGADTIVFSTSTCDSVVIQTTQFVGLDTIRLDVSSCDFELQSFDTVNFVTVQGCDSIVITNNIPLSDSDFTINVPVTDPAQVGLDTLVLVNNAGCDSLLITNSFLDMGGVLDTFFMEVETCDVDLEPDTTIGIAQEVIITIPILIRIDTTFIEDERCSETAVLNDTLNLSSVLGCDSIVVISIDALNPSLTILEENTCDSDQILADTIIFTNEFGCDSLVVTNYELIDIDTTFLQETTCDTNQELILIEDMTSMDGCDSTVVTIFELVDMDTITSIQPSCFLLPPDTILVEGAECPTIEIVSYENMISDTTFLSLETCTGPFGVETFDLVNTAGCDSVVVQVTIEVEQSIIPLEQTTCIPNLPNDTLVLEGQFCDSLVITSFVFVPNEPTMIEVSVCNPDEFIIDTTFLTNAQGCDSLIITNPILVEPDTIRITEETCDPTQIGIDTLVLVNADCPSLVITETILQGEPDTLRLTEITCDELIIGNTETEVFENMNGCDSVVLTSFVLENFNSQVSFSIDSPVCAGEANGAVNLEIDPAINVLWLFDQDDSAIREDLPAGVYQVQLSQNACDTLIEIEVLPTPSIFLNLEVSYVSCSSTGGIIFSQVSGGTAPYTYEWQDLFQDSIRENLFNGDYILTLTDAEGCSIVDSVQIENVLGLDFDASKENVSCFEGEDGSIVVELLSGIPPYEVLWQDGSEDLVRENLQSGEYSCTISDDNNCNVIINRTVRQPDDLIVDFQVNSAGEFEALVSGGTPPYNYSWNDGNTTRVIKEPISGFAYEVTVTDANDCIAFRDEVFAQVSTTFIDFSKVALYPNPHLGDFNFSFDQSLELESLIIYNIYGQEIEHFAQYTDKNILNITIPSGSAGTYFLSATFKQGNYHQKMIVF